MEKWLIDEHDWSSLSQYQNLNKPAKIDKMKNEKPKLKLLTNKRKVYTKIKTKN